MRTQLELWQVVKNNFDEYFETGLCLLILELKYYDVIKADEKELLEQELSEYGYKEIYFLGLSGDQKPRLKFIDKMIKKHSKKIK